MDRVEVKRRLVEIVRRNVSLNVVAEWLWEDYGVKVSNWDKAIRVMLDDRVTIGDIISFLEDNEVEVDLESLESSESQDFKS